MNIELYIYIFIYIYIYIYLNLYIYIYSFVPRHIFLSLNQNRRPNISRKDLRPGWKLFFKILYILQDFLAVPKNHSREVSVPNRYIYVSQRKP